MAQLEKKKDVHRQERGWGYELWLENNDLYCGKILHLYKGKRGSLHFHLQKEETMHLRDGLVNLLMIDPETGREYVVTLNPGDTIFIPRGQVHQIIACEESDLFEFSTQHFEHDSYRVKKGD